MDADGSPGRPAGRSPCDDSNPRGEGHGPRLLDGFLTHVPASATLLVTAANEQVAEIYRRDYGFVSYDPDFPLLLERAVSEPTPSRRRLGEPTG